ncbi:hypothetical protein GQE99_10185 [Maritimibacter sp. DP07]|jgi:hypothetical protein|uniref:Uncharacterized protein n=1 Tax=Maritimibacter harenae TaxID=2606218 RepID=A0A845M016_9RHOB|nr:hypothetical protein [Maritimibacter harenae]MZR13385.1 hypothetical protein [Maritimibacter harenae]
MTKLNEHTLFKPVAPVARTLMDKTTQVAREIVTTETAARTSKTDRLRKARLAKILNDQREHA